MSTGSNSNKDKTLDIVVNGTEYPVDKKEKISFTEVAALAFPGDTTSTFSITYSRGHSEKAEGILSPGSSVKVVPGMSFSVDRTGQS